MAKKREKLEIIRDILLVLCKVDKIKPTRVLHSSNLSPQMFNEYINLLLKKGFIEEIRIKNRKFFIITKKGLNFLQEYRSIEAIIRNFGL